MFYQFQYQNVEDALVVKFQLTGLLAHVNVWTVVLMDYLSITTHAAAEEIQLTHQNVEYAPTEMYLQIGPRVHANVNQIYAQ